VGGTPPPILNQCLEEAVGRLVEVTRWMADTGEVVDAIDASARTIGALAAGDEAVAVHDACVKATATTERIRQEMDVEEDAVSASLQELGEQAAEAASAIERLLATVRQHATHLAEVRGSLVGNVDAVLDSSRQGFEELAQAMAEYQDGLEAALAGAESLLRDLQGAVNAAHDGMDKSHGQWEEAMGRLAGGALETTREVAAGVQETAAVLGRDVVEFANDAIDLHNAAVLALRRGFLEDAADPSTGTASGSAWTGEFPAPIETAVQDVDDAGAAIEDAASESAQALRLLETEAWRAVNRVSDPVARITPIFP
jgi:hypothetical protein